MESLWKDVDGVFVFYKVHLYHAQVEIHYSHINILLKTQKKKNDLEVFLPSGLITMQISRHFKLTVLQEALFIQYADNDVLAFIYVCNRWCHRQHTLITTGGKKKKKKEKESTSRNLPNLQNTLSLIQITMEKGVGKRELKEKLKAKRR